jgi:hypothetical protein
MFIGQIENCNFNYKCPKIWDDLVKTDNEDIRYCSMCNDNVYKVTNEEEFLKMSCENKCVYINDGNNYTLGIPVDDVDEVPF